jgi:hypothetical protein
MGVNERDWSCVNLGSQRRTLIRPSLQRIKSDTPVSRIATPGAALDLKNIGFHYVWTVAYPLPIDRRGHESKALLADHGYSSRFNPSG